MPAALNVRSIGAPFGPRDSSSGVGQLEPEEVTVCVVAAWSNSQRTVSPVSIVTFGGANAELGLSTESMIAVLASAGFAKHALAKRAATSVSSADRRVRMGT